MIVIWIKIAIIALGLLASIWIVASQAVAYRRTGTGRYLIASLVYLPQTALMLWVMYTLLASAGQKPDLGVTLALPLLGWSKIAIMWLQLDSQPGYPYPRNVLLFRPPSVAEPPDPARGLHVPTAPPAPLSSHAERRLTAIVLIVAVVAILAVFVISVLV